ncbi:hypothetical protein GCM10022222_61670 [Amycolatopsis ultiminotia]|uniref:Peptidase M24 domain-containing protein n=1 Tax=Amycolatopsis ultiminotia TaxID=543629 RepID=A0ABP6XNJ8_9PSEU
MLLTSEAGRRYVLGRDTGPVGAAVVLTVAGSVAEGPDAVEALSTAGVGTGPVGVEDDVPWALSGRLSDGGVSLRSASDVVFAELVRCTPEERAAFGEAAELAAVGYTAVMDHLHVGMDVREITANVDRSVRRAGGLLGWYPPGAGAGSDLVTVHGHDPRTARLTATSPIRYTLHPTAGGSQGLATATAVLCKAGPALRAAAESCSAATEALITALRPGKPLREGHAAAARELGDRPGTSRILALRGGSARCSPPSGEVCAGPDTVLGVHVTVGVPGGAAVELAETVLVTGAGPEPLAKTPLRLVELY